MGTNEYIEGSAVIATKLGFQQREPQKLHSVTDSYYELPANKGQGYIYQLKHDEGFFITLADYTLLHPDERTYEIEQMCIELYFFESGEIQKIENGKKTVQIGQGVNLHVNRKKRGKVSYGADVPIRYVSIVLFEQFMEERIKENFPEDYFELSQTGNWKDHNYNTPELTLAFLQLKKNLQSREKKRMYYECKVGEILSLIVSNYRRDIEQHRCNSKTLHSSDLRYLQLVKAEIDRNIIHPPTMDQLCKLSGMGLTKLKESFKIAFHTTIYGYLREVRMKHALLLLSDDNLCIKHIAASVGFESPGKFALTFKCIYGMLPSDYRKLLKADNVFPL